MTAVSLIVLLLEALNLPLLSNDTMLISDFKKELFEKETFYSWNNLSLVKQNYAFCLKFKDFNVCCFSYAPITQSVKLATTFKRYNVNN